MLREGNVSGPVFIAYPAMLSRFFSACLCLLAACSSAPAPEPAAATTPPPPPAPTTAAPAAASAPKGPAKIINQQVELCAQSSPDGSMNLAASFSPGCGTTTMSCQVKPVMAGMPATDIEVEVKVGAVPPTTCDKPGIMASTTCPLPSHADPKAHTQISDMPQQSQIPMRVNGTQLGILLTDDFGKPNPNQCWRMPFPKP